MEDRFIPLSVPNLKGNELAYVSHAVETEWVSTGGPYVDDFEKKIAEYVHVDGAVACQNGTSGLHTAMLVVGVKDTDVVVVPTLTFIAAVNPVHYIGAEPVFMDCDTSLCINPTKLRQYFEEECDFVDGTLVDRRKSKPVRAIVVVHVFGNMADMVSIMEIAHKYNVKVIEDATEALGTYYTEGVYSGKYAGTIGDVGVYSFNGNKIITTGGGGMIISTNPECLKRAKHLTTQAKKDALYYIHDEVGYNYRMTNLQAALGLAQLEQLEKFIEVKNRNYAKYKQLVEDIPGYSLLEVRDGVRSNRWFYGLICDGGYKKRDSLIKYLGENHIQSRPIWGLIHEQIPYGECYAYKIECAKEYYEKVVNVPCSTNLTLEDVEYVVETIRKMR